jgi:hypothetical protein
MRQLHRFHDSIYNHRSAQACTETEKKHTPTFIAPESLHRSVIDHFDRTPKRLVEIKTHPATAQIVRLSHRTSVDHRPWETDGDTIILPTAGNPLCVSHHLGSGHLRARIDFALFSSRHDSRFDVRSSYIDHKNLRAVFGFRHEFLLAT